MARWWHTTTWSSRPGAGVSCRRYRGCAVRTGACSRAAGLPVEQGVLVDDRLTTDDSSISAVGEGAQHRGRVYGLVAPVWEQAAVLARVLTGDRTADYRGSRTITRLKVAGLEVAAMGA